jgi:hypothetical protein
VKNETASADHLLSKAELRLRDLTDNGTIEPQTRADLHAVLSRLSDVETAFVNLCEALGIQPTALAYLDARADVRTATEVTARITGLLTAKRDRLGTETGVDRSMRAVLGLAIEKVKRGDAA